MFMHTAISTMTFNGPFNLNGFPDELPAGDYQLESEEHILEGLLPMKCLRESVTIHLHILEESPGLARTLTVPWVELDAAKARDRNFEFEYDTLNLAELLSAPIIRLLMKADHVTEMAVQEVSAASSKRILDFYAQGTLWHLLV